MAVRRETSMLKLVKILLLCSICFSTIAPSDGFIPNAKVTEGFLTSARRINTFKVSYSPMPSTTVLSSANNNGSLRGALRQATGFSLTAFRASMRALTGVSLSAIYVSALAATSGVVRKVMTLILAPLPAWFRYFLQPILVLYYAPLIILRSWSGPTKKRAIETHKSVIEGWKDAVVAAKSVTDDGYWPIQVDDDGSIVAVYPPDPDTAKKTLDVREGIAESVKVAMEQNMKDNE